MNLLDDPSQQTWSTLLFMAAMASLLAASVELQTVALREGRVSPGHLALAVGCALVIGSLPAVALEMTSSLAISSYLAITILSAISIRLLFHYAGGRE